jgi:methylmalonyl-CoA/ethylmalonyl-CoA epimerase
MIKKVHLIGVIVDDLKKAKEFYQNLGFSVDLELDLPSISIRNAFVSLEGTSLELIEPYPGAELPYHRDGVINHLTFLVEGIEQTMEEMKSIGAEIITELGAERVDNATIKFVFFKGVNGEIIELWERTID